MGKGGARAHANLASRLGRASPKPGDRGRHAASAARVQRKRCGASRTSPSPGTIGVGSLARCSRTSTAPRPRPGRPSTRRDSAGRRPLGEHGRGRLSLPKRQGFWQFDGSRLATASKPGAAALLTARFSLTALEFGARDTGMFEVRSLSDASPPAVCAAAPGTLVRNVRSSPTAVGDTMIGAAVAKETVNSIAGHPIRTRRSPLWWSRPDGLRIPRRKQVAAPRGETVDPPHRRRGTHCGR